MRTLGLGLLLLLLAESAQAQATVTLAADLTASQQAGTTVTFTATAAGGTAPYSYEWWLYNGQTWEAISGWVSSPTFAWTPTTANSQYIVGVWMKSSGFVGTLEANASLPFAIVPLPGPPPISTFIDRDPTPRVIDPNADCTGQGIGLWGSTTADGTPVHDNMVATGMVPAGKAWIVRALGLFGGEEHGLDYALQVMYPVVTATPPGYWAVPLVGMTKVATHTPYLALPPSAKLVLRAGEYITGRTVGMSIGTTWGIEGVAWEVPASCVGRPGMPW